MTIQGIVLSTQLRLYLRDTRGQKSKFFRVGLSRAFNFAPATALERMLGPFDVMSLQTEDLLETSPACYMSPGQSPGQ
jgi:hypothetical protein